MWTNWDCMGFYVDDLRVFGRTETVWMNWKCVDQLRLRGQTEIVWTNWDCVDQLRLCGSSKIMCTTLNCVPTEIVWTSRYCVNFQRVFEPPESVLATRTFLGPLQAVIIESKGSSKKTLIYSATLHWQRLYIIHMEFLFCSKYLSHFRYWGKV